jgi:hypothetical protein
MHSKQYHFFAAIGVAKANQERGGRKQWPDQGGWRKAGIRGGLSTGAQVTNRLPTCLT